MFYRKVTVIGAGSVGATTAQRIVEKEIADVILLDIVEGLAQGKALDIAQSGQVEGFKTKILGTNHYENTIGSDVIVITAGLARKPGMSRDDLLNKNAEIVSGIVSQCAKYSPHAVLLMVTNPLDVMTHLAWKVSGFPAKRVIGMAGQLDSARCAFFISEAIGCAARDVNAVVLGGHGDDMVWLPQHTKVSGVPVTEILDAEKIQEIDQRTRRGGAEIVDYLKTGSAFYAPSSSVVSMVRSILEDRREIIPSCVYVDGVYGLKEVYCGVPAVLGRGGAEEIYELDLTGDQKKALAVSSEHVRENCAKLGLNVHG